MFILSAWLCITNGMTKMALPICSHFSHIFLTYFWWSSWCDRQLYSIFVCFLAGRSFGLIYTKNANITVNLPTKKWIKENGIFIILDWWLTWDELVIGKTNLVIPNMFDILVLPILFHRHKDWVGYSCHDHKLMFHSY